MQCQIPQNGVANVHLTPLVHSHTYKSLAIQSSRAWLGTHNTHFGSGVNSKISVSNKAQQHILWVGIRTLKHIIDLFQQCLHPICLNHSSSGAI